MSGLYDILISGGCGGTAAWIVTALHKKVARREEAESRAFATVTEKRIADLESASKAHGEMLAALKTLARSVELLSSDIKEMIATNAAQSQAITNLGSCVTHLREDIGEVRRDLKEHLKDKHTTCNL